MFLRGLSSMNRTFSEFTLPLPHGCPAAIPDVPAQTRTQGGPPARTPSSALIPKFLPHLPTVPPFLCRANPACSALKCVGLKVANATSSQRLQQTF